MDSVEFNVSDQLASVKRKRDSASMWYQQLTQSKLPNDRFDGQQMPIKDTAECMVQHEGVQMISTVLPVNIDSLFETLNSDSKFLQEFNESRKIFEVVHTEWQTDGDQSTRSYKYKMTLNKALGPKYSEVTETMTLNACSVDGSLYSVNRVVTNDGIPYADTFEILAHHCMVRTTENHTMFTVNVTINFKKSVFSMIKTLIEKKTIAGMLEFYNDLLNQLNNRYGASAAKVKRRRHSNKPEANAMLASNVAANKETSSDSVRFAKARSRKSINQWFLIAVLFGITALNVGLFVKLMSLEESVASDQPYLLQLASQRRTDKDWSDLLQGKDFENPQKLYIFKDTLANAMHVLQLYHNYLSDLINERRTN